MNVRRGLFRLWIVLALLWAVFIGWLTWERIYDPVLAHRIFVYEPETRTFAGLLQVDDIPRPRTEVSFAAEEVTLVLAGNPSHAQARAIVDAFRPEYVDSRHWEAGIARLRGIGVALLLHLIPSLLVLGVGALSGWAFAGPPPKQGNRWVDEHQAKSSRLSHVVRSLMSWIRSRRAAPDISGGGHNG